MVREERRSNSPDSNVRTQRRSLGLSLPFRGGLRNTSTPVCRLSRIRLISGSFLPLVKDFGIFLRHYAFENAAIKLGGTAAACEFLELIFLERERELLVVAFVDDEIRLLELLINPGTRHEVVAPLSGIIRRAVVSECTGIILAHNHPSRDSRPSDDDLEFTRKVSLTADSVDITLLDHLIFNHGPVLSFRHSGLI